MEIILEYKKANKDYKDIIERIAFLQDDIEALNDDIENAKEHIAELEANRDNKDYPIIRESIKLMVNKIKQQMNSEQQGLEQQINLLKQDYDRELNNVAVNVASSIQGGDILSLVYATIDELTPSIEQFGHKVLIDPITETYGQLKQRSLNLRDALKNYNNLPREKCLDLAEKLSLRELIAGIDNPKVQLGVLTAYIAIASIIVLKLPVVMLSTLTGLTVMSLIEQSKKIKQQIQLTADLERLKNSYYNCQDYYKDSYNTAIEEEQQRCADNYNNLLEGVKTQQEEVIARYNKLIAEKENLINSDEFIKSSLQTIINAIEEEKATLLEYEEEQDQNKEDLAGLEKTRDELKIKCDSLHQQIEEKYINNLKPGTERLLCKNLFLGFNEAGDILTLEFNCASTLILYTDTNSQCVTSLMMMIFVQMLCSTSLASLSFYIFDTDTGASDFAIFKQDKLKDIMHISSTTNDINKAINDLHNELQDRNTEILRKATNIEEYNKLMISRNSLTKDYKILLVQETSGAIFNNSNFEQLCKTGAKVGIIPIVFLSHDIMQRGEMNGENDVIKNYLKILKAIKNNFFKYITVNKNIIKYDDRNCSATIQRLENLKRVK